MADTVVDKLVIALRLDPNGIDKGIAQAQSKLTAGFKGIMGKVFAPLMAGMSFAGIFDSIYAELKQMNSLSKATKSSIEDITAWSRAVTISGGDVDSFSQTLMSLNQNLTRISVTGTARVKPFFEKLGIDATELAKKPVLDSLGAIAKAIDGMDKRESANMLRSMGIDNGTIKLLQEGERGYRELINRQRELGVYTEKDAKAFSAMNKNFKEITSAIKTLFIPAVMMVLDVASKVTRYLTTAIVYIRKNIDLLRGALLVLSAVFSGRLYKAVVQFLTSFMHNPFGMFIVGLSLLLLLLEDLWVYAKGGKTAFGNIWKNFGKPQDVMKAFEKAGEVIGGFFKMLGNLGGGSASQTGKFFAILLTGIGLLIAAIGWVAVAIGAAGALIIYYWDDIVKFAKGVKKNFDELPEVVIGAFKLIGKMIASILSGILNFIIGLISGGIAIVSGIFESIKATVLGVGESISTAFQTAFETVTDLWNGLVESFDSGCSDIAGFLSNAADTALSAWNRFITWLEQKWNWLKSLLPSFESIANKLPSVGTSVSLATKGSSGGTTNNTNVQDRRNITNHYHTAESVKQGQKQAGFVSYADTGWAGP